MAAALALAQAPLPEGWLTPVVRVGDQVIYSLQPKQMECFRHTPVYTEVPGVEHIGYGGAAGGAKSHTARAIATAVATQWWGSTTIIFRKTEKEVLENHYQKFRTELPEYITFKGHRFRFYTWNGQDMAFTFPGFRHSRILLGHLGDNDDVFKYIGNEYDCMIFEESTMQTEFQVQYLTGNRLRATVDASIPFCVYPSNPGNVGHQWYKRVFVDRDFRGAGDGDGDDELTEEEAEDPSKYAFVQAKLADNLILQQRDPAYAKRLNRLPEPYRSWQRDGDFEAGAGSALPQLRRAIHLIRPFHVPDYWEFFGAFDWGYDHPWVFGEYAANEDGRVFKLQTITGRRDQPWDIAEKVLAKADTSRMRYIDAGRDVFEMRKARGETGSQRGEGAPTLNEHFIEAGIKNMRPANTGRILGLQNLRAYLAWENTGPEVNGVLTAGDPGLCFFDNRPNRKCLKQLEAMVANPDCLEDVLKVDANEFGEGGDDIYDETRYAINGRPRKAVSVEHQKPLRAFDPAVLKHEMEKGRRGLDKRDDLPARRPITPTHTEQGDYY